MTKKVLTLALDKKAENARELGLDYEPENTLHWHALNYRTAPTQNAQAMFEALEKFVAQPKEEKLHPVHIGVDVTREGTAVTAFYRKPDAVMEMFYSQFHPLAQPEQEPVAWFYIERGTRWVTDAWHEVQSDATAEVTPLYTTPPQRTWVGLTDEEVDELFEYGLSFERPRVIYREIEAKLKEKNT